MRAKKRATIAKATLFAVLAAFTFFTPQAAGQTPAITTEEARRMLETHSAGKKLGNIDLTAVDYFREIELGKGNRAIVVSANYGGGIAIFSPTRLMESSIATGEVESIRIFDLNGSGVSQILTDEVVGRGTGILIKNFNLYALDGNEIKRVWQGLSYKREGEQAPWQLGQPKGKVHEVQNFIRFDVAGAGYPSRMTYLTSTGVAGRFRKTEYVMAGSALHTLTEPEVKK